MSAQTEIERALYARFAMLNKPFVDMAEAPDLTGRIDPMKDTMYRLDCAFGEARAAEIGEEGANKYVGFLQIAIYTPSLHAGLTSAYAAGEEIIAHFQRGTVCAYGTTQVRCRVPVMLTSVPQDEPKFHKIIVRIPWYAYLSP